MKAAYLLVICLLSFHSVWAQVDTLKTIAQRWVMDNEAYLQELIKSGVSESVIAENRAELAAQPVIYIHFKADGTYETNQSDGRKIEIEQWAYLPKEKAISVKGAKLIIKSLAKNKMTCTSSDQDKIIFTFLVDASKTKSK
ncbi:MAG: hypothetical protein MUE85_10515 [Microscillaceae bacterium]|jgi:hypothetical protein|nr:hypothetical protein [Microscillaceae bacterium]